MTAAQAAGVIYIDFKRGYIHAHEVGWEKFFNTESLPEA